MFLSWESGLLISEIKARNAIRRSDYFSLRNFVSIAQGRLFIIYDSGHCKMCALQLLANILPHTVSRWKRSRRFCIEASEKHEKLVTLIRKAPTCKNIYILRLLFARSKNRIQEFLKYIDEEPRRHSDAVSNAPASSKIIAPQLTGRQESQLHMHQTFAP